MVVKIKKHFFQLYHYIVYRLRAKTTHGIHSPFVFDLLNKVIYNNNSFYVYNEIEACRERMLSSDEEIQVYDWGAGANAKERAKKRTIRSIASQSLKPPKYAQLLFRLADYFQPATILEIGTSLGITTAYFRAVHTNMNVITLEGCPNIAAVAKKNWESFGYRDIQQHVGNFAVTLPQIINEVKQLDFVFFDGNHKKEATLNYFEQCFTKSNNQTLFVIDDIYWSKDMKAAWQHIKADQRVSVSIDLFYFGLVFFKKGQVKQDFVIRF